MYKNAGAKIKALAWIGLAASVVLSLTVGIVVCAIVRPVGYDVALILLPALVVGVVIGWLANLLLYAYGELVDRTTKIEMLVRLSVMAQPKAATDSSVRTKSEIFCKKCGVKFDLNAGALCPNCGCDNHR